MPVQERDLQLPQGLQGRCWMRAFPRWQVGSRSSLEVFPASPWNSPSRASSLGHRCHGITSGCSTTGASPWGLHLWDITTRMIHHCLLFFHAPKASAGACADPLQLPSPWLGRRRDLPVSCRGSAACSRASCDLGSPRWAPPKLLP